MNTAIVVIYRRILSCSQEQSLSLRFYFLSMNPCLHFLGNLNVSGARRLADLLAWPVRCPDLRAQRGRQLEPVRLAAPHGWRDNLVATRPVAAMSHTGYSSHVRPSSSGPAISLNLPQSSRPRS